MILKKRSLPVLLTAVAAVVLTVACTNPLGLDTAKSYMLGVVKDGEFVPMEGFPVIPFILEAEEIPLFAKSNYSRVLQLQMSKNKHNQGIESVYVYARWKNSDGTFLNGSSDVKMYMDRVGEDENNIYFRSNKRILFLLDGQFQGLTNDTYIIMVSEDGGYLNLTMPYKQ